MAVNDVISDFQSASANSDTVVQPASGDQWCIFHLNGNTNNIDFYLHDGSNYHQISGPGSNVFDQSFGSRNDIYGMATFVVQRQLILTNAFKAKFVDASDAYTIWWSEFKTHD